MSTQETIARIAEELSRRNDPALVDEISHMQGISEAVEEVTPEYKAWMVERARLAEEDIKAGRVLTVDEARARLKARYSR